MAEQVNDSEPKPEAKDAEAEAEPAAEAEEPANNASEEPAADDSKDDSKEPERIPKDWPGDGLPENLTPDKGTPDEIEFKWDKSFNEKKDCDTLHMLYLLQLALELTRKRTIERNNYFKSINRSDRYIDQLDNPQIITNFINWHNEDKDKNKFDGKVLEESEPLFLINEMIGKVGDVKLGPATKIWDKLKKSVVIEKATWMDMPQPKLKLKTWGKTKMYDAEKVIVETTNEEIITLLTYEAKEFEIDGPDDKAVDVKDAVQGVLAFVEAVNAKKTKKAALEQEPEWKEKMVAFFREQKIDGKMLMETGVKVLCQDCMNAIVPPTELNEKGKPRNIKLRGGVNQVLRALKGCYVHGILSAAAAAQ